MWDQEGLRLGRDGIRCRNAILELMESGMTFQVRAVPMGTGWAGVLDALATPQIAGDGEQVVSSGSNHVAGQMNCHKSRHTSQVVRGTEHFTERN